MSADLCSGCLVLDEQLGPPELLLFSRPYEVRGLSCSTAASWAASGDKTDSLLECKVKICVLHIH